MDDHDQTIRALAITQRTLEITRAQLAQTVEELATVTLTLDQLHRERREAEEAAAA